MIAKSALLGICLGLAVAIVYCSRAACQSPTASTETQVWPVADAHVEMPSHLRVLAFSGVEQGVGYSYQQWYAAAALGYHFKPIFPAP